MEESQRYSHPSLPRVGSNFAGQLPLQGEDRDADLVVKQRVLQEVFERQSESLKNVLRSYVLKTGTAQGQEAQEIALDLVSELYVVAMKTAEKFDASRSGLPWLLRIGYNLVLRKRDERMRLRRHEAPLTDLAAASRRTAEGDEVATDAELFDRLSALRPQDVASTPLEKQHAAQELLSLVSADDRTLLQLAVVHGLSGDALAQHLGIKPATARQRLHRAIGRLRVAYLQHLNGMEASYG